MARRQADYPAKRTMNLYYKPDRTTRPATIALYVLFCLTILLGLSKVLVYDLWAEVRSARQELSAAERELNGVMAELADYDQVLERYRRYAATEEEAALIDRMEVLELLDSAVGSPARLDSVAISGDIVRMEVSGVDLARTAEIVSALEAAPLVESTAVNTASTTEESGAGLRADILIQLRKEGAE